MSSSMRNAIQRRNHKERAQPAERQKYGLLEKRKDYRLRAADHKAKQARLKALRAKAAQRNPDEFNYGMIRARTRDGGIKVTERPDSEALGQDAVKLLKTQDSGYLRTQAALERRRIEKLEAGLAFTGVEHGEGKGKAGGGKHTVFVGDEEEMRKFRAEEFFDTHPEMLERRFNRPRREQVVEMAEATGMGAEDVKERKKAAREREARYRELEARMKREEELKKVARENELQRARMQKGAMVGKNKWAKIRKR